MRIWNERISDNFPSFFSSVYPSLTHYIISIANGDLWSNRKVLSVAVLLNHITCKSFESRKETFEVVEEYVTEKKHTLYNQHLIKALMHEVSVEEPGKYNIPSKMTGGVSFRRITPLLLSRESFQRVGWAFGANPTITETTVHICIPVITQHVPDFTEPFFMAKLGLSFDAVWPNGHANYLLFDREVGTWVIFEPHGITRKYGRVIDAFAGAFTGDLLTPKDYSTLPGVQSTFDGEYCVLYGLMMVEEYIDIRGSGTPMRESLHLMEERLLDKNYVHQKLTAYILGM